MLPAVPCTAGAGTLGTAHPTARRTHAAAPLLGVLNRQLDLSIIVVNWNTVDLLRDCLASVAAHTHTVRYEMIVVDNGSHDGSVAMLETEFPEARLLVNERNLGFATANNQGLRQARGRYLLLLNSDTVVLEGALDRAVQYMDEHAHYGALGPTLRNADGSAQLSVYPFPHVLRDALVVLEVNRWPLVSRASRWWGRRRDTGMSAQTEDVDWVMGACLLLRREALEQAGVLDAAYFFGTEETDLQYRLRRHGWPAVYLTEATIIHLGGGSRKEIVATHLVWYLTGRLRYYRLHFPPAAYLVMRLAIAVSSLGHLLALLTRPRPTRNDLTLRAAYVRVAVRALRGYNPFDRAPLSQGNAGDSANVGEPGEGEEVSTP